MKEARRILSETMQYLHFEKIDLEERKRSFRDYGDPDPHSSCSRVGVDYVLDLIEYIDEKLFKIESKMNEG